MKKAILISLLIASIVLLDNISDCPDKPVFKEDKQVCIDSVSNEGEIIFKDNQ